MLYSNYENIMKGFIGNKKKKKKTW